MFLRCTICGATNTLPASRLNELPRCVRCRQGIRAPAVTLSTDAVQLAEATRDAPWPVLVDLWAPLGEATADPVAEAGRLALRELDQLARKHQGHLLVLKLNVQAAPELVQNMSVRELPTFVLYRRGIEVLRQSGRVDAARLEAAIVGAA